MKNRRFDIMKRKFLQDKGMWLAAAFLLLVVIASIAVDYTGLDPEAIDQLLGGLGGNLPRFEVGLVVRIHILVVATGADGVTARLNLQNELNEPDSQPN